MFYSEAFEERLQKEKELLEKWGDALESVNVTDDHKARTTAICLEAYMNHLHDNPQLIAEDQMQTGSFTGINLALLGLLSRAIPNTIAFDLVGVQAMLTPKSPIFTMKWTRDTVKGGTTSKSEMWIPGADNYIAVDRNYTSQNVSDIVTDAVTTADVSKELSWANTNNSKLGSKPIVMNGSAKIVVIKDAKVIDVAVFEGAYYGAAVSAVRKGTGTKLDLTNTKLVYNSGTGVMSVTGIRLASALDAGEVLSVDYEYKAEGEANIPEQSFSIVENTVKLTRRQLRGKYTLDSVTDLKAYHGIDIDSELAKMMEQTLMAEINAEIINDLRMLAAIVVNLDFADYANVGTGGASISGNYDDASKVLVDVINAVAAKIWTTGRLGYGNFIVGNPITLSLIDRTGGFQASGISYNGKDLSLAGSLGGKIKVFKDPLFPQDEILVGYKGSGAMESGYVYCPYLPITATPQLYNQETGDPAKIFYTRYGKTFNSIGAAGVPESLILNGENQYARIKLANLPKFVRTI